jgi:hypothetical protein
MIFHPFLAAQASAKMLFTSTGSTRSPDTRTLLAYSITSVARDYIIPRDFDLVGPRRR